MTNGNSLPPVLFDLGGTIVDYTSSRPFTDWEGVVISAISPFLDGKVSQHDLENLVRAYRQTMREESRRSPANVDVRSIWRRILRSWDIVLEDTHQESLIDKYCRSIADGWVLFPDALDTLRSLRERGYPLALVSNVYEPASYYHDCTRRLGIAQYLEVVSFSSEVGWQKPDRRIFEHTLTALGRSANEAIFVGDDLVADIYGASQLGMTTVWIRSAVLEQQRLVDPHYEIDKLPQLLEIVTG